MIVARQEYGPIMLVVVEAPTVGALRVPSTTGGFRVHIPYWDQNRIWPMSHGQNSLYKAYGSLQMRPLAHMVPSFLFIWSLRPPSWLKGKQKKAKMWQPFQAGGLVWVPCLGSLNGFLVECWDCNVLAMFGVPTS